MQIFDLNVQIFYFLRLQKVKQFRDEDQLQLLFLGFQPAFVLSCPRVETDLISAAAEIKNLRVPEKISKKIFMLQRTIFGKFF